MDTRPLPSPCHWIRLPSWLKIRTNPSVLDVAEKFSLPKKWWQLLDGTIVIASDAAFAANLWIQLQFATDLMTKFTAVFAMADFGKYYFECFHA